MGAWARRCWACWSPWGLVAGVMYTSQVLVGEVPLPQVTPTGHRARGPAPISHATSVVAHPDDDSYAAAADRPRPLWRRRPPRRPPPAAAPADCPNPAVRISEPADAIQVSGVINIVGSANIDDFRILQVRVSVAVNSEIGPSFKVSTTPSTAAFWVPGDTRSVPSGDYEFRLVVVDSTGKLPCPRAL